jgi:hypothetical protein
MGQTQQALSRGSSLHLHMQVISGKKRQKIRSVLEICDAKWTVDESALNYEHRTYHGKHLV